MTVVALVLATIALSLMVWACTRNIVEAITENTEELRNLRLKSRVRINTASMQSGAKTDEQALARMGRATFGKRVVVGGDQDSELHTGLSRAVSHDDD